MVTVDSVVLRMQIDTAAKRVSCSLAETKRKEGSGNVSNNHIKTKERQN